MLDKKKPPPHTTPHRTASLEITCEGKAKAFGMYELPDSFFNKMSTTVCGTHTLFVPIPLIEQCSAKRNFTPT